MRDAGATPGDRDLLSKQFFTQLDPVLDYLTIWTLCFLFFFGTSAVRGTDVTPEFPWDNPWASQKSGWSAVNYWAIRRPTAYEPINHSNRTLTLPPVSSTRTANKAGDVRGGVDLTRPSSWYFMSQTCSFTDTCFFFNFYVRLHTSVLLTLHTTLIAILSIFVFLRS